MVVSVRTLATALLVVALVGCGAGDPTVDWATQFHQATELVPERSALDVADPATVCDEVLGPLRSARSDLGVPPTPAVDGPAQEWFEVAEGTFFDCPPSSDRLDGFDGAYEQLTELEAEVEAALDQAATNGDT